MLIFKLLVFDVAGDFAPAGATRGQWKQTKSAVAPLTPSQCILLFIDLYCCLGTNGTPTKFVSIKLNKLRWGREAVQRATAKPSGRLRRGEISASTRESSMKEKSTQSRERVKGGTPLRVQGSALPESRGSASGASSCTKRGMYALVHPRKIRNRPARCRRPIGAWSAP